MRAECHSHSPFPDCTLLATASARLSGHVPPAQKRWIRCNEKETNLWSVRIHHSTLSLLWLWEQLWKERRQGFSNMCRQRTVFFITRENLNVRESQEWLILSLSFEHIEETRKQKASKLRCPLPFLLSLSLSLTHTPLASIFSCSQLNIQSLEQWGTCLAQFSLRGLEWEYHIKAIRGLEVSSNVSLLPSSYILDSQFHSNSLHASAMLWNRPSNRLLYNCDPVKRAQDVESKSFVTF